MFGPFHHSVNKKLQIHQTDFHPMQNIFTDSILVFQLKKVGIFFKILIYLHAILGIRELVKSKIVKPNSSINKLIIRTDSSNYNSSKYELVEPNLT